MGGKTQKRPKEEGTRGPKGPWVGGGGGGFFGVAKTGEGS